MPTNKNKPPSNVIFLRVHPPELKQAFKAYCARRGITIKEAIESFMLDAIKQDGKLL